jgi:hypothetical protein
MKKYWNIIRTIIFIVIGIKCTLFINPELLGTLENYIGYMLLILGVIDSFFLIKKYLKSKR